MAMCRKDRKTQMVMVGYIIVLTITVIVWNYKFDEESENPKETTKFEKRMEMETVAQPKIPVAARDAVWQDVDGSSYVYAAFYDDRHRWPRMVRIIGATKTYRSELFRCQFWYSNGTSVSIAKVQLLGGWNRNKFTACSILCPFKTYETPESVSVVTQLGKLRNRLVINMENTTKSVSKGKTIGICVKPMHNLYNDSVRLVEFIELNRLLGVDHVTFYKSSISLTTECILRQYVAEGRATLMTAIPWRNRRQWQVKPVNDLAALNDCLYRNMHVKYVAFLDLDEFIVPTNTKTLHELIKILDAFSFDMPYFIGSYDFQNAFFYLEWPDDSGVSQSPDAYTASLTTLLKTKRMKFLQSHGIRSKYIVKPEKVKRVGLNSVTEFLPGYGRMAASELEGILHHYRHCEYGGSKCTNEPSTRDTKIFKFRIKLIEAVRTRWQRLQKDCGLEDIHSIAKNDHSISHKPSSTSTSTSTSTAPSLPSTQMKTQNDQN